MADLSDLTKRRSAAKGRVTRKLNELSRLVAEDEKEAAFLCIDSAKLAFGAFITAHEAYHGLLSEEEDIAASDLYFDEIEQSYTERLTHARSNLKAAAPSASLEKIPTKQYVTSKLPPTPKPDVFDGNPELYPLWKASFETLVGKHDIADDEKMFFLREYTSGAARNAIEALFLCPNSTSYAAAREILDTRFGDPSKVCAAFRRRLEGWPRISEKDGTGLQRFSDFLVQLCVAKRTYPSLNILSDEFENKKILTKLPSYLVDSWIKRVVDSSSFPSFDDFSEFIKAKAKVANHSLRESVGSSLVCLNKEAEGYRSGSSMLTDAGGACSNSLNLRSHQASSGKGGVLCPLCSGPHRLSNCETFSKLSLEDRKSVVSKKGLCFGCFRTGHLNFMCQNKETCKVCRKNHPTLMHDYSEVFASKSGDCASSFPNRSTSMVLPVRLKHKSNDQEIVVYALLDTQSNTNFISEEVADSLGVLGRRTSLQLSTMSGKSKIPTRAISDLLVQGLNEGSLISVPPCFTRDSIPCSRDSIPTQQMVNHYPHLSGVKLPPYCEDAPIGLLLGYHTIEAFKPLEIVVGEGTSPFGWKTPLGWCLMGPHAHEQNDELGLSFVHGCLAMKASCRELTYDAEFESQDKGPYGEDYSQEDLQFTEIMTNQMSQKGDGHYIAPLPLKLEAPFPDNRFIAERRLGRLKSKFVKDPNYFASYRNVVSEMVTLGFAEIVPKEPSPTPNRIWYLPHHSVDQGKLRVVFDCSVKFHGVSLNERLLQGPDMLNSLLGILFRFRLGAVALTCDIEKMYHQFHVSERDRDLLRFLWWENGDLSREPVDHRMCVHLFGATSSPGVATFGLRQIASDFSHLHSPESVNFVKRNFYVDDGAASVNTHTEASKLIVETQNLLAHGGLRCHKVMSNSSDVLSTLPATEIAPISEDFHKILGILWNVRTDQFHFSLSVAINRATRRNLLSTLSKFYDPLGFIAPLLIGAKFILQDLCIADCDWDDPLPDKVHKILLKWQKTMNDIGEVVVQRHVLIEPSSIEIHHFSDASVRGYCAVSYIRYQDELGKWQVAFLFGKCRVVPLRPTLTVPRLELVAAVLCVRLASQLRKELPFHCVEYFWTDSTIVLGYIKNRSTRFKVFVANRIQSILTGSQPAMWRHVNSEDNPADLGSRGIWSARWLQGPGFLHHDISHIEEGDHTIPADDTEVISLTSEGSVSTEPQAEVHTLGNWISTVNLWAWVSRFIANCRGGNLSGELSVREMEEAKGKIFLMTQNVSFGDDISTLRSGTTLPRSSQLYRLDAFIGKDGLLRVGGRLRLSGLATELKHPVVLPATANISKLVIDYCHQKTHHQGRGLTCAEVRNHGLWMIGLIKAVKRLIHACVFCSRLRGPPCQQKMADLPPDRLTPSPPFTFCGLDLFGPFLVKQGRCSVKRYGIIVTCLISRAVHLDIVYSQSTDSFVNAFRRLIALRGPVRQLRCDQGTNFIGAKSSLSKMGCDMVFNPPASSHRGGVYERMIGVARRIIEGILLEHSSRLDDEGLSTVLAETASVMNSRPLSVDHMNDPTSLEPLTPNHLLTFKSKVIPRLPDSLDTSRPDLFANRQWRRVQYLIDLFWSRWREEIVNMQQSRTKWNIPRPNLKVGDVVLVIDEGTHRSFWKMARILEARPSSDGLVRTVRLRLADKSVMERPIQKVVHLLSSQLDPQ